MARLSIQLRLKNAQKLARDRLASIEVFQDRLLEADERAKNADLVAAQAVSDLNTCESDLKTANNRVRLLELELATLRGYTQRIVQTDNAHHAPSIAQQDGQPPTTHLKFGLPDVEQPVRLDVAPKFADSFYRNR